MAAAMKHYVELLHKDQERQRLRQAREAAQWSARAMSLMRPTLTLLVILLALYFRTQDSFALAASVALACVGAAWAAERYLAARQTEASAVLQESSLSE